MEVRYLGFAQRQNARSYQFDVVEKGEPSRPLIVTADLSLFRHPRRRDPGRAASLRGQTCSRPGTKRLRSPRADRRRFTLVRECPLSCGSETGRDTQGPPVASVGGGGTISPERLQGLSPMAGGSV